MVEVNLNCFAAPEGTPTLLNTIERHPENNTFELPLTEKKAISPDTYEFTFGFPNPEWTLGLAPAHHIKIYGPSKNPDDPDCGPTVKPYTPISPVMHKGSVTFVIKVYRCCDEFPNGGFLTQWMEKLNVGDNVTMEGPVGRVTYTGNGTWKVQKDTRQKTKIGLVAGGSGITPHFQLMDSMRLAKETVCDVKFLFSNKTAADQLCKQQLDIIAAECPNITVHHTLTREESDDPNTFKGRVTADMLKEIGFPEPGPDTFVHVCGPKGLNEHMIKLFDEMGYTGDMHV